MSDYEKCVDVYQVTVRSHEGDVKETRLVEEAAWVDFDAKPPKDHKYASRFRRHASRRPRCQDEACLSGAGPS